MLCRTCLTGRTGDKLGDKCRTAGCLGVIEESQRIQDVTDELPEPMTCPRRLDNGMTAVDSPFTGSGTGLDRWRAFKTSGHRTCSYCSSLHPDDFLALVKASAEAAEDAPHGTVVEIEPSDKRYKVYVHQPGVRNAMEGGIKFYTHHLPWGQQGESLVTRDQEAQYLKAIKNSQARFELRLAKSRAIREAGIEPGVG